MLTDLSLPIVAAVLVGGYLMGTIPFGVLITRFSGVGDVRKIGSGNIGATNVLRTGRKDLAALTLLGDGGKGLVAVLLFRALFGPEAGVLAGGAAFVGHLFPVWLGFKGGKGVATFFGTLLAAAWPVGMAAGAIWLAMFFIFRLSSLAGLTAAALAPILALFVFDRPYPIAVMALVMAVLIFIRHKDNIGRLLRGEEPRSGVGKKKDAA